MRKQMSVLIPVLRKLGVMTLTMFMGLTLMFGTVAAQNQPEQDISGTWLGVLKFPGGQLRIVFKIAKNGDGSLTTKLDSPDQGAKDIPFEITTFKDGKLHLEAKSIHGVFDGSLNDKHQLVGQWKQGSSLPLTMERVDEIPKISRPQDPKPPYPYNEEEVVYTNKAAGFKLAGTLTLPRAKGPFPAVILITGSGAQDRDETLAGHKPFWVLADYLTRKGIAVLRVDDRGVGGSGGSVDQSTTLDFAGDVLAGIDYLKSRKEIDSRKIGLIGHSEGGLVAPLVAVKSQDIEFIVLMAGPGLPGEEIVCQQTADISKAGGVREKDTYRQLSQLKNAFSIVKREKDPKIVQDQIHDLAVKIFNELPEADKKAIGNKPDPVEEQLKAFTTPWFRFFLTYDPRPTLKKVTCPVLAVIGSKDLQVSADKNLPEITAALKEGGNKDYTVKELPGLNHLFQSCKTGSPEEYANIQETISPVAMEVMGEWILKHTN